MIVTPERWYMGFWLVMLIGLYFTIKFSVVAAKRSLDSGEPLTAAELLLAVLALTVSAFIVVWG